MSSMSVQQQWKKRQSTLCVRTIGKKKGSMNSPKFEGCCCGHCGKDTSKQIVFLNFCHRN